MHDLNSLSEQEQQNRHNVQGAATWMASIRSPPAPSIAKTLSEPSRWRPNFSPQRTLSETNVKSEKSRLLLEQENANLLVNPDTAIYQPRRGRHGATNGERRGVSPTWERREPRRAYVWTLASQFVSPAIMRRDRSDNENDDGISEQTELIRAEKTK